MLVVDVFMYNGEPIVAKRQEYLAPLVDKFVVIEARVTHSGAAKTKLYTEEHADIFAKYPCEIVVLDAFPPLAADWDFKKRPWVKDPEPWWRERCQRDYALAVVRRVVRNQDAVIVVGDSDEIPSIFAIRDLVSNYANLQKAHFPIHLSMDMFYYSFKWKLEEKWAKAFAISSDKLSFDTSWSDIRMMEPVATLANAGWHCSYFMAPDEVRRKLQSFAHTEVVVPDNIDDLMRAGKDITGQNLSLEMVDEDGRDVPHFCRPEVC